MKFEMKNRLKPCAAVSIAIMVIALVMTMMGNGMNLGIDFTGGTLMTYNMGAEFNADDVKAALADCGVAEAQIAKTGEENTQVQIRISDVENTDDLRDALVEKLSASYPGIEYVDITRVGAVVGGELISNAIKSLTVAAVLMLIYIAFRFDLYSGLAAVIGLAHDIAIMLSFVVICNSFIRVETTFVAALLTIVGYSINNTIIIFDRIRENAKVKPELPKAELVSLSVRECLGRTIMTSVTTLVTILALYILGVAAIKEFALPIIVGVLAGTWSSNLISGYIWAWLEEKFPKKEKSDDEDEDDEE